MPLTAATRGAHNLDVAPNGEFLVLTVPSAADGTTLQTTPIAVIVNWMSS